MNVGKFVELLDGRGVPVWLDMTNYAGNLLADGVIPWFNAADLLAWQCKAHKLLQPDVIVLPLGALAAAWIERDPKIIDTMRAKLRATWPLKVLLNQDALRSHLECVLQDLRASFRNSPLAISVPSPRRWLEDTMALSDISANVGEFEIDTASMYVADFLRLFGKAGLDAVLLEESSHSEPISSREVRWYQPVINVAGHFRWDLGLRLPTTAAYSGGESGFDFLIAPKPIPGPPCGLSLNDDFWLNGTLPRNSPFVFWNIPEHGRPEQVLDRLSLLRSNGLISK